MSLVTTMPPPRQVTRTLVGALCVLAIAAVALAAPERSLSWDAVDVEARLDDRGTLHVEETQTIRFWGDWNGGERVFRLDGPQQLTFDGIDVYRGRWWPLASDTDLDTIDDYAFTSRTTLRWRSRLRSDPPFNATVLRYRIRYRLSKILVPQGGDAYVLDHDFAFPARTGPIKRLHVRLALDPAWRAADGIALEQTSGVLPPGRSFVLTLPLHFVGSGAPEAFEGWRTPTLRAVVGGLLGLLVLGVSWLFFREWRVGRFAPIETSVDEAWLQEHVLRHHAEIVGAAWDEQVGTSEVLALLARLVRDGVIAPAGGNGESAGDGSTLRLVGDRQALTGYARDLVEALFFDGRTETSTEAVKEHYSSKGFTPAALIRRDLEAELLAIAPGGTPPRSLRAESALAFFAGVGLLVYGRFVGDGTSASLFVLLLALLVAWLVAVSGGDAFRADVTAGPRDMWRRLIPAFLMCAAACSYLWWYVGSGLVEIGDRVIIAFGLVCGSLVNAAINALKSRQHAAGLAFRKTLTAAREYFRAQLAMPLPALRDEWYPWVIAFGLRAEADAWSVKAAERPAESRRTRDEWRSTSTSTTSRTTPTAPSWTGFGGGRSGGGGGGASWAAAADGLAAGVQADPPRSSGWSSGGSSGGSSSGWSSSSSGSSRSSSSGGGGGGGW